MDSRRLPIVLSWWGIWEACLFIGRRFCTEDALVGHSGLYCGDFLVVSMLVCV